MAGLGLYSHFMDYHLYKDGTNPNHDQDSQTLAYLKGSKLDDIERKRQFTSRVEQWLKGIIRSEEGPVTIAIAPGHSANPDPSGFMHDIVGRVLASIPHVTDGRKQLIRTKTVHKSTAIPRCLRTAGRHLNTITIHNPEDLNKGKTVFILDDVWTTGSTLNACEEVMRKTNPTGVKLIAIGKLFNVESN